MTQQESGPQPADAGPPPLDVWSWVAPEVEAPKNGPLPEVDTYSWTENLCREEPPPNGDKVGTATFSGTRTDADHFYCDGSITLDPPSPWGTIHVSGDVALVKGKIGEGLLKVEDSTTPLPFSHVRMKRKNPKRYTAQG